MDDSHFTLRFDLKPGDHKRIRSIAESVNAFNRDELDIVEELAIDNIEKSAGKSDYQFLLCENDTDIIGYTCYGHIRGTKSSYDLFWIVVCDGFRGEGIGKKLLAHTEERIYGCGGKKIYVETSSKDSYYSSRQFYSKCGYTIEAVFKDFYDDKDDKVVYLKKLE